MIARLERARPRYVLWDHSQVAHWGNDPVTRSLSDYIWQCYQPVAALSPFLILERLHC